MDRAQTARPNIILIVIDALRARNLGCYGADDKASPNIDRLAANGLLFENCYSCWNTTDQSLTSILTGRYPRTHGIHHHGDKIPPEDLETFQKLNVRLLAEILKPLGYKTLAIDWMSRWFKSGFDYYGYSPKRNLLQKIMYYLFTLPYVHVKYMISGMGIVKIYKKRRNTSARTDWQTFKEIFQTFRFIFELARIHDSSFVTGLAKELIHQAKGDHFFLFIHYWDTHPPYNCPRRNMPQKKSRDPMVMFSAKYQGAVTSVDMNVGKLLQFIKNKKLIDDTLIIITSDHGESLTEHDIFFDHHGLYDVTTHVPLIFFSPRHFPKPKRINTLVQHVDLVPTLCELLGVGSEGHGWDGESLMPLISGNAQEIRDYALTEESYAERKIALRTKGYKYIYAPDGEGRCKYCQTVHGGAEELFNLDEDPEETDNRIDKNPSQAERMRKKIKDLIHTLDFKRQRELEKQQDQKPPPKPLLDAKEEKRIRKKLRSLGYMD